jgi:opacity protein-like surface antigen
MLIAALQMNAQIDDEYKMEVGAGVGMVGYLGDYNDNIAKCMQPSGMVVLIRNFKPYMGLRRTGTLGKLKGSYKDEKTYYPEHAEYSFNRSMVDVNIVYEYNFWPYGTGFDYRGAKRFTPYIYIGLGGTYVSGNSNNVLAMNIPLGLGVKYKVAERLNVGLDWGIHFALSDKLDGVVDPYSVRSSGAFKNKDAFTTLQLSLTYSFAAKCKTCNKD